MTETRESERTETARRHDDHELIEGAERAPSASGTAGGDLARTVGARDEEARGTGEDASVTRVEGRDKPEPPRDRPSDHEGAAGR